MKGFRKDSIIIFVLLSVLSVLFIGCSPMTSMKVMSAITKGIGTIYVMGTAAELHNEITKADLSATIDGEIEIVRRAVEQTLEDLDIQVRENWRNQAGDGARIKAKADSVEIKVLIAKKTEKITAIGIWAGGDVQVAEVVYQRLLEEKPKTKVSSEYVVTKGGYQVKVKPDPKAGYYGATAPEGKFKKIGFNKNWIQVEGTRESGEMVVGWIPQEAVKDVTK